MKVTTNNIEKEIVSKILRGDEAALTLFYKENKDRLFSFILQKVSLEEDAEEILQDTFIAAIGRLRDFTFKSSLGTFLFAIAKNKIADFYRRKRLTAIVFSKFPGMGELVSELLKPEEVYEAEELKKRLYRVLRRLRPKYQKILRLKYLEGYTVLEISERFSESVKSIESQLFRARKEFALRFNQWEKYRGNLSIDFWKG